MRQVARWLIYVALPLYALLAAGAPVMAAALGV